LVGGPRAAMVTVARRGPGRASRRRSTGLDLDITIGPPPPARQNACVSEPPGSVVVGLDVGGTKTNATVLTDDGRFLVDHMVEVPSGVLEGRPAAIAAIGAALVLVLELTAVPAGSVRAIGLDTPGPASADGV